MVAVLHDIPITVSLCFNSWIKVSFVVFLLYFSLLHHHTLLTTSPYPYTPIYIYIYVFYLTTCYKHSFSLNPSSYTYPSLLSFFLSLSIFLGDAA
jgi:hypothetical protein